MTDPLHPIPKGREKPKRAKPVRKPKSERPTPNMQPWLVTYQQLETVTHRVVLPVGEEPHLDENGWLQVGNSGTNGKHIGNITIKKNGAPYYKTPKGDE